MNQPFVERLAMYSAYHRHPANHLIHVVGVPVIALGTLIALSRLPLFELGGYTVTGATVTVAAMTAMYLRFDVLIGLVCGLFAFLLLLAAERIAQSDLAWPVAAVTFIGGWMVQLVGHAIEGKKPAILDNFPLTFMAPPCLILNLLNMLGLKRGLYEAVEARWAKYRAALVEAPGLG